MVHVLEICFIILFILSNTNIKPKYYFFISLISLSTLAFFFDPVYLNDVKGLFTDAYRFVCDMELARLQGDAYAGYAAAPLSKVYVQAIAALNDNRFMPLITCLLTYGTAFYLLNRIGKHNGNSDSDIIRSAFCFIMLISYLGVIGNVRYSLAMVLFTLIAYCEIVERKKKWCIGYFILPLFHPGSLCFIILRILSLFKWKVAVPFMAMLLAINTFYSEQIFLFLISLTIRLGVDPILFIDMQWKYDKYQDMDNWVPNTFSQEVVTIGIMIIFFVWLLKVYAQIKENSNNLWLAFVKMGLWSDFIALGFMTNYQMRGRFLAFYTIMIPVLFLLTKLRCKWSLRQIGATHILYYLIIVASVIDYFGQTFGYNLLVFNGE